MYLMPLLPISLIGYIFLRKFGDFSEHPKLLIISPILMLTFSFCTSIHCGSSVADKEKNVTYLLKAMGTRSTAYWLSNFTFDYAFYLITGGLFLLFVKLADF